MPGEILNDMVRFRDYQRVPGTSSVTWTPVELDEEYGDEVPGVREEVIPGSIRIPGRTITYKESDTEEAAIYVQTCKTDEEIEGAVVLGNDAAQEPGNLEKPNFTAPAGKVFGGWSTEPKAAEAVYNAHDPLSGFEGNTTLYPVWVEKKGICPLYLNIKEYTLKDQFGNEIQEGVDTGFKVTTNKVADLISIDSSVLNACAGDTHQLIVEGKNPKAFLQISGFASGEVRLKNIQALMMSVSNTKSVIFEGAQNIIGGGDTSALGLASVENVIVDDSKVILYNKLGKGSPYTFSNQYNYDKVKLLDLIMDENLPDSNGNGLFKLKIAGETVAVPAGVRRIAILDDLDSTWLAGNITITNEDGSSSYVRGVAENSSDTSYIDSSYSDNNIYGHTFGVTDKFGENGQIGLYQAVRLPLKMKQLSITVPTSIVFNVYTSGGNNQNGDYGFIAPEYELKNDSVIYEDVFDYKKSDGSSVTRRLGKQDAAVEVGYEGVKANSTYKSMYTLGDYSEVTDAEMSQSVSKPIVCLEVEANHDINKRIAISEESESSTTFTEWFTAAHGVSNIQLKVPKAYTDGESKRYYQIPKDIQDNDKDNTVLRGLHTMKLGFALN